MILKNYHSSWKEFLTQDRIDALEYIEHQIGTNYTPDEDKVLRFMSLNLDEIRVVILGQDPYKPAGVANGRAFQPNDLVNWNQPFRQVSLKNIIRAIYSNYNNLAEFDMIPSYKEIVCLVDTKKFLIKEPKEWFDSLENQGVLLLNTSLTCEIGKSNSHKHIWSGFMEVCIDYISSKNNNAKWFLWGGEAQSYKGIIEKNTKFGNIYTSKHPMLSTATHPDDFLRTKCFKETSDIINWLG